MILRQERRSWRRDLTAVILLLLVLDGNVARGAAATTPILLLSLTRLEGCLRCIQGTVKATVHLAHFPRSMRLHARHATVGRRHRLLVVNGRSARVHGVADAIQETAELDGISWSRRGAIHARVRLLALFVVLFLELVVREVDLGGPLEQAHALSLVLDSAMQLPEQHLCLAHAHFGHADGPANHERSLLVEELKLALEVHLVKVQHVHAAKAFKVLVDDA